MKIEGFEMSIIDTAIILAAGRGSRLKELSLEQPKPMTEVNNTAIIDNLIRQLIDNKMQKIVVVIGYFAEKLKAHILSGFKGQVEFVFIENEIYDKTNNIYSLYLANKYMDDGFYLFEADVFCEDTILADFLKSGQENVMLIDTFTQEMNGTVVRLTESSEVKGMYLNKDQDKDFDFSNTFKTINFYKISKDFVNQFFAQKLAAHINGEDVNSYYEQIIKEAVDGGYKFYGLKTKTNTWWEIDTHQDLEKAEELFKE